MYDRALVFLRYKMQRLILTDSQHYAVADLEGVPSFEGCLRIYYKSCANVTIRTLRPMLKIHGSHIEASQYIYVNLKIVTRLFSCIKNHTHAPSAF